MDTIKVVGFALSAAASYLSLIYKLCQVRRNWRDLVYLTVLSTLVLQSLTFTMGAIALSSPTFLGVPNLAILLMHLAAVAYCVSAQILMMQWANPLSEIRGRIRGWLGYGGGLIVVLVALFVISDSAGKNRNALATGSPEPLILTYLLLFIVSQAIPCVTIYRQCVPYARRTTKPWLRRALRMIAASAVVLFLYCVARLVNILTAALGISIGPWTIAASVLSAAGIVISSIGLTMPSWGPQLSGLGAWGRNYSAYRALYPLWHSLYQSSPGIALEPPSSSVTDLNYRLHRRVIEIRDGWRALRPYMDGAGAATPPIPENGQLTDEERQAFVEAAKIKRALEAKSSGVTPEHSQDGNAAFDSRDAKNLAAEVDWLKQVSLAYGRLD